MSAETEMRGKFFDAWRESWTSVLLQLGLVSPTVTYVHQEPSAQPPAENPETLQFSIRGNLAGELQWTADAKVVRLMAQLFTSEPLDASVEYSDKHRAAFSQLLAQVADRVGTDWKENPGKEIQVGAKACEPDFLARWAVTFQISDQKMSGATLALAISAELGEALTAAGTEPKPEAVDDTLSSSARNLNLLLDVELEAIIRVGERQMLLREIFRLTPGAVVELDQPVNGPASLLVGGKLMALGNIVTVDGTFALQVTQVASAAERMQAIQVKPVAV